jgi:regulator of protease activity HflC (stomatin/prohibitin superfamily)
LLVIALLIVLIILIVKTGALLLLKEYERAVVYRFGKLARVGGPGWIMVIPLIEEFTVVDLRVQTIDIPKQNVITKDNIMLRVDAVVYIKVKDKTEDIVNSVVKVENYKKAARLFIEANIRDVMGQLSLSEAVSGTGTLNTKLKAELALIAKDWGIAVDAVEIQEIIMPEEVQDAMHEKEAASQKKRAIIELAEAEREKINAINQAASGLSDKSVVYYYIKGLEEMSKGASTKWIFPMEFTKLAGLISGQTSGTKAEQEKMYEFLAKYGPAFEDALEKVKETKK